MPTRLVREAIISSSRINALSFGAEVFYRRLLSVVDDFGRFHASPATLRGACWPTCPERVTEDQVSGWLRECSQGERPLVDLYEVAGARYLVVDEFGQQKRSKSKFPEPVKTAREAIDAMRGLQTDCSQNDNNCSQSDNNCEQPDNNCEQNDRTRRRRILYSEAEAKAEPDANVARFPVSQDLSEVAQRMYRAHPKTGDRTLVEHALIAAIGRGHSALLIESKHAEMCKADDWAEKNGRFAPKLANWIDDDGFLKVKIRDPPNPEPYKMNPFRFEDYGLKKPEKRPDEV